MSHVTQASLSYISKLKKSNNGIKIPLQVLLPLIINTVITNFELLKALYTYIDSGALTLENKYGLQILKFCQNDEGL